MDTGFKPRIFKEEKPPGIQGFYEEHFTEG